jgi:hypothetical protein
VAGARTLGSGENCGAECPLADGGLQGQPVSGTLVDSPMLDGGSMLVSGVHCGNLYQIGYSGTT